MSQRAADAIEKNRKHYEFWDDEKQWIESTPYFFIASSFDDFIDCNIESGDPGFIKVVGPNTVPGVRRQLDVSHAWSYF